MAIAWRIPGEGEVTVSERKSMRSMRVKLLPLGEPDNDGVDIGSVIDEVSVSDTPSLLGGVYARLVSVRPRDRDYNSCDSRDRPCRVMLEGAANPLLQCSNCGRFQFGSDDLGENRHRRASAAAATKIANRSAVAGVLYRADLWKQLGKARSDCRISMVVGVEWE
jgi:hypothetical protein